MPHTEAILGALTDEAETVARIAKKAGMSPSRCLQRLKVLEKYGLAARGEEVLCESNGRMITTWRKAR